MERRRERVYYLCLEDIGRPCSKYLCGTASWSYIQATSTRAVRGSQLFNCLPVGIRNIIGKSVGYFKRYLDSHLKSIPDQPFISHYVPCRCTQAYSLIDQSWYQNDNQDNHQGGVSIDSNSYLPRQLWGCPLDHHRVSQGILLSLTHLLHPSPAQLNGEYTAAYTLQGTGNPSTIAISVYRQVLLYGGVDRGTSVVTLSPCETVFDEPTGLHRTRTHDLVVGSPMR